MRLFLAGSILLLRVSAPQKPVAGDSELFMFAHNMQEKNIARIMAEYSPDAVFVDPDGHATTGKKALRSMYEKVFATYDSDLKFDTSSVVRHGAEYDVAGRYSEKLRVRSIGKVMAITGTYHFFYRKRPYDGPLMTRMEWTLDR